jgi:hypothetical protein
MSKDAKLQWLINGCPNTGIVWKTYQFNKRAYKKAVKEEKCKSKMSRINKLLDAWNSADSKKFWKCVNRYSDDLNNCTVNGIDPGDFVNVFKDNIVDSDLNVNAFTTYQQNRANAQNNSVKLCDLQICDVEAAINRLNRTTARDCNQLTVMHVLFAHPVLIL